MGNNFLKYEESCIDRYKYSFSSNFKSLKKLLQNFKSSVKSKFGSCMAIQCFRILTFKQSSSNRTYYLFVQFILIDTFVELIINKKLDKETEKRAQFDCMELCMHFNGL